MSFSLCAVTRGPHFKEFHYKGDFSFLGAGVDLCRESFGIPLSSRITDSFLQRLSFGEAVSSLHLALERLVDKRSKKRGSFSFVLYSFGRNRLFLYLDRRGEMVDGPRFLVVYLQLGSRPAFSGVDRPSLLSVYASSG